MYADRQGAAHDRVPECDRLAEVAMLRETCRRQARTIATMTRVFANLRQGVGALKAENAALRASGGDARRCTAAVGAAHGSGVWVEAQVPLDVRAPGAARIVVAQVLAERVAASALERAKLVISELVSNSVRHSGAPAAASVVVRVRVVDGGFWLEVEDPGRDGVVAQRAPDEANGGGFGLHLVQTLSEQWGIDRAAQGGTRVWAHLSDAAPSTGPDYGDHGEATLLRAAPIVTAGGEASRPREPGDASERSGEVHVIPQPRTATWGVYIDAVSAALSEHTSETEAESAARAHVRASGTGGIVVHDRYHRTHACAAAHAD
jgi:anti-sigma regulatory factor (Ser/Thr protein kinase)